VALHFMRKKTATRCDSSDELKRRSGMRRL